MSAWVQVRCPLCGRTEWVLPPASCWCPCLAGGPKPRHTEMEPFHEQAVTV